MATDGSVRSFPSRAWTCGSLADGVAACAEIAGISLGPDDANDPCEGLVSNMLMWPRPFRLLNHWSYRRAY